LFEDSRIKIHISSYLSRLPKQHNESIIVTLIVRHKLTRIKRNGRKLGSDLQLQKPRRLKLTAFVA
jgi:hypothetical protein